MSTVRMKRIYDQPTKNDGYRVLVDRLWPRGVSKDQAALDLWLKDVAPSTELRTWFDHRAERFEEFRQRYTHELGDNPAVQELQDLRDQHTTLTLLYGAKDPEVNHARVLLDYLKKN